MLLAPAMNTLMWTHPATEEALDKLQVKHKNAFFIREFDMRQRWGARVVPPVSKTLACGDTGVGAMAAVQDIAAEVAKLL